MSLDLFLIVCKMATVALTIISSFQEVGKRKDSEGRMKVPVTRNVPKPL